MQVLLLGPLEARADGRQIQLGAAKQRAVLAMLALRANSAVSADELMEGLWGEHPPASAPKMVQQYISQLRRLLAEGDAGAVSILTRGRGYELRIAPDDVDAECFVRLVSRGSARQALSLWRGTALDDLADEPFAAVEIRRLQELRLDALEQAIEADLADGRHGELIGELEALISEHPLSERLHGLLMLALYRSGRQAEALEAYRRARRQLVDDIGIEPGPDLQRLHEAILHHDASLDAPPRRELPPELRAGSPMFGREAELARLRGAWARALEGCGSTVVIEGPPGSGRTRLAAELAGEVREKGGLVLLSSDAPPRGLRPALVIHDDPGPSGPDEDPVLRVVTGAAAAPPGAERIVLGPLGAQAIGAIARLYGQEHAAEWLAERSGGLPAEAHRIASAWAREEAERHVITEALRTADEREELRQAERRLSGRVAELQSMRERTERPDARSAAVVCPYKGLASFDRDDADFFFGRDRLVAEMVARLVGAPLLGIVGASGSGKSSVLRAGLLAELAKGVLPGSSGWTQVLMRPGEHPAATLQRLAPKAPSDRRVLIAVDQFEEAFTVCRDPSERAAFIGALAGAAKDPERDVTVLLAVRADFYGRCAEYPALGALLGANQLLVGAMRRDELRRAIEMPAQRARLHVEPELADALLADTADEPGALPMLSTALLELWQHRDGDRLSLAAYERTGGVRGAVARMAERAYARLDPIEQGAARRILLRLTGDAGVGAHVRRRVPLAELEGEGEGVLEALADSRLVTLSEGTVEVAHEALLQEWPRLAGWLEEDAAGRRVHAHLIEAAREWTEDGNRGDLYRGARLASALEWRAEHEPELNATERRFLDASRLASERARRRMQLVLAAVTALLVVAAVAAIVALGQRGRARDEARAAEAQRLGAQALNTDAVDLSLLLARQGVALDDDRATQLNLLAALRRSPAVVGAMRPGISGLTSIEQPAGGRVLAVSDIDGGTAFLDPASRRRLAVHRASAGATGSPLASAPDGSRVAEIGLDFQGAFIDVFDSRSRQLVSELRQAIFAATPESAVFSPDSGELLMQGENADGTNHLWRWDVRGEGQLRADVQLPGAHSLLLGFAGSKLLTYSAGERAVVVRDPTTLRAQRRFRLPAGVTGLVPSSGEVAMAVGDGSLRLLDLRSGRVRTARGRHDAPVTAIAFSPDGRTLVTAGRDGRLIVWDVRTASAVESLETGAAGTIEGVALTPDGRTAYTAGRDGTVLMWDLQGSRRFERPLRDQGGRLLLGRALVAPAGAARFGAVDDRGAIDLFDSRSLRPTGRIRLGGGRRAVAAAISPDGRTLAVTDRGGRVQFWDLRDRRPAGGAVYAHAYEAQAVAFSGNGRWLVTGGFDTIVHLWDARSHRLRNTLVISAAADLSLNPQGTLLAVTLGDQNFTGGLRVLSVPDLKVVRQLPAPFGTVGRFTPDGRSLIYGDRQGRIWIYDTRSWKLRGRPLDLTSPVQTADVSPDGRTLATTSVDGKVGLWDLPSRRPIGGDQPGTAGDLVGAGFIDGGRQLVVLHDRGGFAWDLRPASWEQHACAVAGRTLTRAEWKSALGDRPYAPACR